MSSLCTPWVSHGQQIDSLKQQEVNHRREGYLQDLGEIFMKLDRSLTHWLPPSSWGYPGERGVVAYFSMEIAISPAMPTYSGGLGVLAGDTLRAAADAGLRLAGVTLAPPQGLFPAASGCKRRADRGGPALGSGE